MKYNVHIGFSRTHRNSFLSFCKTLYSMKLRMITDNFSRNWEKSASHHLAFVNIWRFQILDSAKLIIQSQFNSFQSFVPGFSDICGFVTTGEFELILNDLVREDMYHLETIRRSLLRDPTAHTGHSYNTEAGKPGNSLDFCKLRKHFHSRGFNSIIWRLSSCHVCLKANGNSNNILMSFDLDFGIPETS